MIEEDGRVPVLDIRAVARISDGSIKARGAIEQFTPEGVKFAKSGEEQFDAVILATGFRPDLRALLPDADGVLDKQGRPLATGRETNEPGLYFCGQIASPTGQLREIGIDAKRIASRASLCVAKRCAESEKEPS